MSLVQLSADVSHFIPWSWWVVQDEFRSWFRDRFDIAWSWLVIQDEFSFWLSIAVIPLLAWAVVRGTLAISKDVWMLMRAFWVLRKIISVIIAVGQKVMRMFGLTRKHDQGSQTDEWEPPSLPDEIFYKGKKDVFHLRGCHYLSLSDHDTFSKRACSQCNKLWNKGMLPLPL